MPRGPYEAYCTYSSHFYSYLLLLVIIAAYFNELKKWVLINLQCNQVRHIKSIFYSTQANKILELLKMTLGPVDATNSLIENMMIEASGVHSITTIIIISIYQISG